MAAMESCSWIDQRSVIKFLVAEQCKTSAIFRKISAVYEEACFSPKNVYKWAKLFKEEWTNVFDEDRPGSPTKVQTPTMIKSVDDIIQSNRRVKAEDVAYSLNISIRIAHKIIHYNPGYSKVSCCWVPKMLTEKHK